jgi:hypothetical protein
MLRVGLKIVFPLKILNFMAAFWAVFTFGGSGPAITALGSLVLKQEIQIQILNLSDLFPPYLLLRTVLWCVS